MGQSGTGSARCISLSPLVAPLLLFLTAASPAEQAARVTITRDDWGIAHVRGKTDADAVFGMIYAQAEDDFPRIEANYLTALGRTAEAEGEKALWQDLRARLYVSEPELKAYYARSPPAMRRLMDAWAAGLNHYLATHPQVKPRVLTRFEPWMALSFTEGSIGGDIERIDLKQLEEFYSKKPSISPIPAKSSEPGGSNGIAIAPSLTGNGTSLLLINPHTSFFFRSELHMTSDEGLDAYGASTWGQFFIYQGFNRRIGWMHTSSNGDSVDEFAEKIFPRGNGYCYRFGKTCRALTPRSITLRYKAGGGTLKSREFTAWMTHRGPIVRAEGGRWIAFAMMDKPVEALQQSFLRTKARDLKGFLKVSALQANSSNTTIFAGDKGEIAYLHPQFVPGPQPGCWTIPSRSTAATRPPTGAGSTPCANCPTSSARGSAGYSTPTTGRGPRPGRKAPRRRIIPNIWTAAARTRAANMPLRCCRSRGLWSLDRLQSAAFDSAQPGFDRLLPPLIAAFDALAAKDPLRARLGEPIEALRGWDRRWSAESVPNTVANFWAEELWTAAKATEWQDGMTVYQQLEALPARQKLQLLDTAVKRITSDFGRWDVPWGEVNRFQRISAAIVHPFSDKGPSIPVPFSSARWGSPRVVRRGAEARDQKMVRDQRQQLRRGGRVRQGVRARAVTAGGESGNPCIAALQRPGRALRQRQFARGLFPPRPARRPYRADLPPGPMTRR